MVAYLLAVRPYKEEIQQTSVVVDEIVLFIVELFFVYIYMKQDEMTTDQSMQLGWIIMLIMIFTIFKNLCILLYCGFLNMRKKMRSMFSAEDEALDSPHTSDAESDTIDSVDTEEIEQDVRQEEYDKQERAERLHQQQEAKNEAQRANSKRRLRQQVQDPYYDAYGDMLD